MAKNGGDAIQLGRAEAVSTAGAPPPARAAGGGPGGAARPYAAELVGEPAAQPLAPLYLVAAAALLGDAAGTLGLAAPSLVGWLLALGSGAGFLLTRRAVGTLLALAGLCLAFAGPARRVVVGPAGGSELARLADREPVVVEGRVIEQPLSLPGRSYALLRVSRLNRRRLTPWTTGLVRLTLIGRCGIRLGDLVRVSARLRRPRNFGNPGEFDYQGYLGRQGIEATAAVRCAAAGAAGSLLVLGHRESFPTSQIARIRARIGSLIDASLSGVARAEMRALVIGDRGGIDRALRERFALTGLAHLLVIAGLHLGFLAGAAFLVARSLLLLAPRLVALGYGNKVAAVLTALAALFYAPIAGLRVSTFRALVMLLSYALALLLDRPRAALASLCLAGVVICAVMPGSTADLGFQLSFASVLAIVLGMRRIAGFWRGRRALAGGRGAGRLSPPAVALRALSAYAGVSFWALLGTAPLTAYYFNQFSLVGLVANAVVVPLMALGGTVCGLTAALLAIAWPAGGVWLMQAGGALLRLGTWLAGWFFDWPLAWMRVFTPTIPELGLAYALVLLWLLAPRQEDPWQDAEAPGDGSGGRWAPGWRGWRWNRRVAAGCFAMLVAATAADAAWWTYQRFFDPYLRVAFLSVGQGDAAVVRFPGRRVMVIDGGAAYPGGFDFGERALAPYLWAHKVMRVDYLVVSHPDLDHFGGLTFMARNFRPAEFWTSGDVSRDAAYGELLDALRRAGATTRVVDAGQPALTLGGVRLLCLNPRAGQHASRNNRSLVLKLVFGRVSFLFTGDIEAKAEVGMLADNRPLHATVLKVPHHGSRTSSGEAFVRAVAPGFAVISLGYLNRFHFPAAAVIDRYRTLPARVLRTDEVGAVLFEADRRRLWLRTWRGGLLGVFDPA